MSDSSQEASEMSKKHDDPEFIIETIQGAIKDPDSPIQVGILGLVTDAANEDGSPLAVSIVARVNSQLGQPGSDLTKAVLGMLTYAIKTNGTDAQQGLVAAIKALGGPDGGGGTGTDSVKAAIQGFITECKQDIATLQQKNSQTSDADTTSL